MSVLITTATKEDLFTHLKNASTVMSATEFKDMNRPHTKEGKPEIWNVFALHSGMHKTAIEDAITKAGKEFEWL